MPTPEEKKKIKRIIKPGNKVKLFYSDRNISNRTMHIRAIVDDYIVVYCSWNRRKQCYYYMAEGMIFFEVSADLISYLGKSKF